MTSQKRGIISQILEFIYWTVTIFSFDHMTDENRELQGYGYEINLFKKFNSDLVPVPK